MIDYANLSNTNHSKFTIIIPHYNTLQKLKRLLDSLQIVEVAEIILVDDNSTNCTYDQILSLAESYGAKLFVNDSGNKGAGACRNIGLNNANGTWVIFADSDDYFLPTLPLALKLVRDNDSDIIFFPPTSIIEENRKISTRHLSYEKLVLEYLSAPNNLHIQKDLRYSFISPCSKIVRRNMLLKNNVKFEETIAANDVYFSITSGHFAKKIAAYNIVFYCITDSSESLTKTITYDVLLARINMITKTNKFFMSIGETSRLRSYMFYLFISRKLGFRITLRLLQNIIISRGNIFTGCNRWLKTYIRRRNSLTPEIETKILENK